MCVGEEREEGRLRRGEERRAETIRGDRQCSMQTSGILWTVDSWHTTTYVCRYGLNTIEDFMYVNCIL